MEVKVRHIYAQSVDAVFTKLGDKASVERKYKDLGARNIKVEKCKLTKTSLELVFSREVPANVPPLLKKFIAEWNLAHQDERWTGIAGKSYQGNVKISIKGVPVAITGKMVLVSKDKGCVNDVTLTIESGIPLIGKKLAEFVGQNSVTELQRQYEVVKASLIATAPPTKTVTKNAAPAKPVAKPVANAAAKKSVKAPATKPPAKKTVAAKTAVAKPVVKAVVKAVGTKPPVKAIAAKPAAKKVAKKAVKKAAVSKPAAKKAVSKVAAKPAAAKKSAPKK